MRKNKLAKNIRFRKETFETAEDYFQHMIEELGFPDILHFFESTLITSGNLQLNIDIHTVSKDAPTLVFVPGTSVYGLCYAELLYEIGKKGYNIIAMDPRGHGRSEGSRGDYTIEELMLDVRNVVAHAKTLFNDKVSLMGSSQGGIVSFYLAAEDLEVDSVICQNFADLGWEETHTIARYPKLAKLAQPLIRAAGSMFPGLKVSTLSYLDLKSIKVKYFGNLHNFIVDDPFAISKISLRAAKSLVNAKMAKRVEEIKLPIFVFQGDKDIVFPLVYTQKIYDRLQCEKQLKVYPNCDHAIMVENVDLIKDDIIAWLDRMYEKRDLSLEK
ncbi:MAG: alpha/beta fold hydrolase [Chitinophagales bacterium]|nr:alpha/beta fold hydrolase [Bacteroidota bacterium]MCB9257175.1 alpha/beta fold hydrolase [Chitinophagales bacterium]